MPFIFLAILIGLPILDIYATLRLAETLGVPGILLFIPGLVGGVMIMKRETRALKSRWVGAIQSMSLHTMVFDSGRRLLAACLFLLPGFTSDVFGLFLLLIPNRTLATHGGFAGAQRQPSHRRETRGGPNTTSGANSASVVDGEYRRLD
jgi:UPF0716 family protein affecting phage T7 exclusion